MDWVWGILISDIIGKHFYRALGPQQATPDPLLGALTVRILRDESRHLAFAEYYLKRNLPALAPDRRRMMVEMRDELMRLLESMTRRVRDDALAFDVEIDDFLGDVGGEIDTVARRVGLLERPSGPPKSGSGSIVPRDRGRRPPQKPATAGGDVMARCFGCLLSLICSQRLATT
jgi:hypothetical protein